MTRRWLVLITAIVGVAIFAIAAYAYGLFEARREVAAAKAVPSTVFVRPNSPVIGPANAPVTIVEFFDPSCESCRAFYPVVKQILAQFPTDVRLVIRYAPFHQGSDEAVRILETARLQNVLEPVLEALLARQPVWAAHGNPNLNVAWNTAKVAGLDLERAERDRSRPEIDAILEQDVADLKTLGVKGTPTFFVNEKPLLTFGAQPLYDLVRSEVETQKK